MLHTKEAPPLQIRWMIRRDMADVMRIEEQSFPYDWTETDFTQALRERNTIGLVAESQERILGFVVYELQKTRLHVLNLAVDEAHRRRGVGSALLQKLVGKLGQQRRKAITVFARDSNLALHQFLAANRFDALGVCRNYYGDDDAYEFELFSP